MNKAWVEMREKVEKGMAIEKRIELIRDRIDTAKNVCGVEIRGNTRENKGFILFPAKPSSDHWLVSRISEIIIEEGEEEIRQLEQEFKALMVDHSRRVGEITIKVGVDTTEAMKAVEDLKRNMNEVGLITSVD